MGVRRLPELIGVGLVAGAAGTAAMTLSSTLEMRMREREASSAPADAAAKVLGVAPVGKKEEQRFANMVHWGYGTGWGAVRGVIAALGIGGPPAAMAHFGVVWGTELVLLPRLDVAPAIREWGATELGVDALHHGVYAATTSVAFWLLTRVARQ